MSDWKKDPRLKKMDPEKIQVLTEFSERLNRTPGPQMLSHLHFKLPHAPFGAEKAVHATLIFQKAGSPPPLAGPSAYPSRITILVRSSACWSRSFISGSGMQIQPLEPGYPSAVQ